jgi:ABC-type nitrate/sulfonate/bicarbonate transport system substrate-binding protein
MSSSPDFLWYTRCPAPTPLSIAVQLGWVGEAFSRLGIDVKSIRDSADPAIRQSHFDHRLDWSFRQGGNIPPLWTKARGRDTRLIGITTTDEFQAIIALPGKGITSAADLAGRKIGIPRNATASIDFQRATALKGLVSALSLEGLTAGDVDIIYLDASEPVLLETANTRFLGLKRRYPYGDEVLALARGDIDAFFVKGAEGLVLANQIEAHIVSEFGFHPDARIRINNGTPRPLTLDAGFVDQRPDLAAELVVAIQRVGDWARQNPNDAVRLIAREIGVGEDAIWAANGPHVHHHLDLTLEDEQIDALDHFKTFLGEWGFIEGDFSVDDWIDRRPLNAALEKQAA